MNSWKVFPCSTAELNLDMMLCCGQSFRWRQMNSGEWISILSNHIWSLKQDKKTGYIHYKLHKNVSLSKPSNKKQIKRRMAINNSFDTDSLKVLSEQDCQDILRDYFQLSVNLEELYLKWSVADENFKRVASTFPGVRILRQDPIENLFSFICSSNNNISRISSMVQKLCEHWGCLLGEVDGQSYHNFPTIEALAGPDVQSHLKELGFGYRAKYISQTAKALLNDKKPGFLLSLRDAKYEEAHKELMGLPGVGPKVADCVCLMSLDKGNAIPVDTHVWQIATRDYLPHLKKNKSLTTKTYNEVGDFFRSRFGEYAGWAHSVLFCSDLRKFQSK